MDRMDRLGLYLHIPFCRSKCRYCDFCSFTGRSRETVERYVARLCDDLRAAAPTCGTYTVDSVFFGGGTPTLLSAEQLTRIAETLQKRYHIADDCEWTAECNPATGSPELFRTMRKAGFNRLSIGLQSAHQEELRALGRIHDFEDFRRTWEEARDAGFDNLNADVMFGIPYQTPERFWETLERVCALQPEHLSAYALSLEAGTPLAKTAHKLPMPSEADVEKMYLGMIERLDEHGLTQYEISNFSKKGYQSRHNRKYWNLEQYLGFGPAAYSDFSGERFGNSRDLDAYLREESIVCERERPSEAERENEYVMLRMRLCEGLDDRLFKERFGHGADAFLSRFEQYVKDGFVRQTECGAAFTPKGFLVSNSILSDVLEFDGKNTEKS